MAIPGDKAIQMVQRAHAQAAQLDIAVTAVVVGIAILGAIGVAGADHPDHDILCAQAALAVLESAHH